MSAADPAPGPDPSISHWDDSVEEGPQSGEATRKIGMPPAGVGVEIDLSLPALPGYRVDGELGRGGMGVVFKAFDEQLKRWVAIKTIREAAFEEETVEGRLRFRTEAEAVAQLRHPNIVQIYEIGAIDGRPYFVFEYVPGGTLARAIARGLPTPRRAAEIIRDLAGAIAHAHHSGIIHRDLKPGNVLMSDGGGWRKQDAGETPQPPRSGSSVRNPKNEIKIVDFGLAKRIGAADERTRSGALVGTPAYMAPEQLSGSAAAAAGAAIDIYALGAILFELLTGRPPFQGENDYDTLVQVRTTDPVPPSQLHTGIPGDLETICLKCLEKEPRRRYHSAAELAEDLRRYLAGDSVHARPLGPLARLGRWGRRNPLVAGLGLAVLTLLSAVAVGGTYAAFRFRSAAANEAKSAQRAADARRDVERTLIALNTELGLGAAEREDPTLAVLWFAHAARRAEALGEPELARDNRVRVRSWLRQMISPVQAVQLPEEGLLRRLEIHANGRHFLVSTITGHCVLGDLDSGVILDFPGNIQAEAIAAAAWSPDGQVLALGQKTGEVTLHCFPSGERLGGFTSPGPAIAIAFSSDGRHLAAGAETVRIWDVTAQKPFGPDLPHPGQIRELVFGHSGNVLSTIVSDGKLRLHDISANQTNPQPKSLPTMLPTAEGFRTGRTQKPIFLPDDSGLIARRCASEIAIWNPSNGQLIRTFASTDRTPIQGYDLAPDGKVLAIAGAFGVRFIDVATGQPAASNGKPWSSAIAHTHQVNGCRFAADGRSLITAGLDNSVRLWSLPDGEKQGHPLNLPKTPIAAEFLPSARFVTVESDGLLRVWAPPRRDLRDWRQTLPPTGATALAMAPDGQFALACGHAIAVQPLRTIRPFNTRNGSWIGPPLDTDGDAIRYAAIRPDVRQIAVAGSGNPSNNTHRHSLMFDPAGGHRIHFCDPTSGISMLPPRALAAEPRMVAYRPDGRLLCAVTAAGHVVLLDSETRKIVRQWDHGPDVRRAGAGFKGNGACRFTPDGRHLLTWGFDHAVTIWDPETGLQRTRIEVGGIVADVAWTPDMKVLAICAYDRPVGVWYFNGGRPEPASSPLVHPDHVFNVAFHPKNPGLLLTASRARAARLWDWRVGKLACPAMSHEGEVTDAAFTPDGRIVTVGSDGIARIWECRTGKPLTPELNLGQKGLAVAVTPDGSYAVFSGLGPALNGLCLADLSSPDDLSANDLVRLGEIVSGHWVEGSGVVRLSGSEWLERFVDFRKRHPTYRFPG